jgi:membrane dipeptidase
MRITRRAFVTSSLALPFLSPKGSSAQAPVFIGDMHFHSFFGTSLNHSRPVAETMKAGPATLVSWAISGDGPWIAPIARGWGQKSVPQPGETYAYFRRQIGHIKAHCAEQNLKLVRGPADVDRALNGEPHIVLAVEGAVFIEDDIGRLKAAYDLGVRHIQLVHFIRNTIGDFQTESPQHNGLTDLGKRVVAECNRLGILVDLAHCTEAAVNDALVASNRPVVWSHSSVTTTAEPHWSEVAWRARQLRLPAAKAIAARGGVVGLWALRQDVGGTPAAYADRLAALADLIGEDHAAIGTDINGLGKNGVLNSYADVARVIRLWQEKKLPPGRIRKLAIGNFARVLKSALRPA